MPQASVQLSINASVDGNVSRVIDDLSPCANISRSSKKYAAHRCPHSLLIVG